MEKVDYSIVKFSSLVSNISEFIDIVLGLGIKSLIYIYIYIYIIGLLQHWRRETRIMGLLILKSDIKYIYIYIHTHIHIFIGYMCCFEMMDRFL